MFAQMRHMAIVTSNANTEGDFYRDVFGWQVEQMPGVNYWRIQTGSTEPKALHGGLTYRAIPDLNGWMLFINVASLDDTVALVQKLVDHFGEPFGDSSAIPTYIVSEFAARHVKVALSGDGGDELFGGYRYYSWIPRLERMRSVTPAPLRRAVAAVGRALPLGARGRHQLAGFAVDGVPPFAHIDLYFDRAARAQLLRPLAPQGEAAAAQPEVAKADACPRDLSPLRGAMVGDFRRYLPDDVLVKVDRASMLASLEVRAPFLDHRVVAFALGEVPDALLARRSRRKILLRRLARRLLPPRFDVARKQGFSVPLARWFGGAWGSFVTGVLADAEPRLFDRRAVHALLEGQRRGWNNAKRLFALTLFELWRREYGVRVGA